MIQGSYVKVLLLVFAAQLQVSIQTEYLNSGKDICRLFKDNTKIRKPGYCDRWIICKNSVSTEGGKCEEPTPFFNLAKGSCQKSLETGDTYCSSPCSSKTQGYVGDTFNCANWYYCDKAKTLSSGVCAHGMHFDQTKQVCAYPQDVTCNAKFEICQIAPTGVKVKDELNCNSYTTCKTSKPTSNLCDAGLYYDVTTEKCIKKALVACERHPLPDEVCGTKKLAKRNKFVPDGATCRGYFYCRDLGSGVPDPEPEWHQCPPDTFFNDFLELCQDKSARKCSEDRCDGRESGFELAQIMGCQNYIKCENGVETTPLKCDDNMYFDIKTESCTSEPKHYGICS